VFFGEITLRLAVAEYIEHYNTERPYRTLATRRSSVVCRAEQLQSGRSDGGTLTATVAQRDGDQAKDLWGGRLSSWIVRVDAGWTMK
jgi:hypothetical protein